MPPPTSHRTAAPGPSCSTLRQPASGLPPQLRVPAFRCHPPHRSKPATGCALRGLSAGSASPFGSCSAEARRTSRPCATCPHARAERLSYEDEEDEGPHAHAHNGEKNPPQPYLATARPVPPRIAVRLARRTGCQRDHTACRAGPPPSPLAPPITGEGRAAAQPGYRAPLTLLHLYIAIEKSAPPLNPSARRPSSRSAPRRSSGRCRPGSRPPTSRPGRARTP